MNIYNKTLYSCVALMSSILMVACSQTDGEQAGISSSDQSTASTSTVTTAKSGITVALSKTNVDAYSGDAFALDIILSDVISTEGGGVSLKFDPTLIQVVKVTVDNNVWDFKNKDGQINNVEGTISDILFSSNKGVEGDARLATIEFKSIQSGASEITLLESSENPFASMGQKIDVSFYATSVTSN